MSRIHRVRTHIWRMGRLEVKDQIFENEESALVYAKNITEGQVKVFDHTNNVTHSFIPGLDTTESYA